MNFAKQFLDAKNGLTDDGLIANQTCIDYAKGIAIGIYDNNNNLIKMNEKIPTDNNHDTRNLALVAKYVATADQVKADQVKAGQVTSTVSFTITY